MNGKCDIKAKQQQQQQNIYYFDTPSKAALIE